MQRITLGISTCLLGENVRYDGGHKLDRYLRDVLGAFVRYVPVCPEVECGLPVPREAMRLVGAIHAPRLVTRDSGIDHTDRMCTWTDRRLDALAGEGLCGFIFKSDSPSSGMERVKVYDKNGVPAKKGVGIFARAFMERFPLLPVEEEGRLHDASLRENFIERIFVYDRWQRFLTDDGSMKGLVAFHRDHKLLIMAHAPAAVSRLGRLIAGEKGRPRKAVLDEYLKELMAALGQPATVKKNTNVLLHAMGYFKKRLSADEKKELLEVIGQYHRELVPLVVPLTLLQHYVRLYNEPYLARQYYLHPHPAELRLRNHV